MNHGTVAKLATLLVLNVLLTSCSGGGTSAVPRYVEDVARAFALSTDDAERMLTTAARRTQLGEEQVAARVLQNADTIQPVENRLSTTIDDLLARVRASRVEIEDVAAGVLCGELVEARLRGAVSSPEDLYRSVVDEWGQEWADELWEVGWIADAVEFVDALRSQDPSDASLIVAESLYCAGTL